MIKISKKKVFISRMLKYIGLAGLVVLVLCFNEIQPKWIAYVAAFVLAIISAIGEQWFRGMYACPNCGWRLLAYVRKGKPEDLCPDQCPNCGEEIVIEK